LRDYLAEIFGVMANSDQSPDADFTILIGDIASLRQHTGTEVMPALSDQGFVLRTAEVNGHPGLLVIGGSPVATLWGVYELVERLGVQLTVNGDVFPAAPRHFHIPKLDKTHEPALRLRMWRQWNTHCFGPESWGLDEQRRFIDQLVKMKCNGILLNLWAP
jgi:alpha-glucuronidase